MKLKYLFIVFFISLFSLSAQDKKQGKPVSADNFSLFNKRPAIVKGVSPVYPAEAAQKGISGRVFIRVLVDTLGNPLKAEVLSASSKIFVQPTIDAAMKMKFEPGAVDGKPAELWLTLPFKFEPKDKAAAEKNKDDKK